MTDLTPADASPSGVVTASAPGRVNLIGEHTDYNGGFVLPTPIPRRTRVELTPRGGQTVHARTDQAPAAAEYTLASEQRRGDWLDYVQGVTWALGDAGCLFTGFDVS